jgi:hypothetical protein
MQMQITGMLYGSKLLQFSDFRVEVLGPDASEEAIKALIERHGFRLREAGVQGWRSARRAKPGFSAARRISRPHCGRRSVSISSSIATATSRQGERRTFEGAVPAEHEVYFSISDSTHFRAPR